MNGHKSGIRATLFLVLGITACSGLRQVEQLPADRYSVPTKIFQNSTAPPGLKQKRITAALEITDSILYITPETTDLPLLQINLQQRPNFRVFRRTFDLDVLTIPFKIRPSVKGFPEQLNPNFSAALYLGRRIDSYHIKPLRTRKTGSIVSGLGVGYGGFIGIGAVTMNPFVTQNAITYEYEGLVLSSGIASIYDAKKFNLGFAIGSDFLVDKNRESWLYHKKLWFGLLFGINLN